MSVDNGGGEKPRGGAWENVGERLFVPDHYRFSGRCELVEFIAEQPFAQLISLCNGDLRVTATPLIREPETGALNFIGHIARRNAHCAAIEAGERAMALFSGPDAYISPRWFRKNPGVPTWSYQSVQVWGRFAAVTDADETLSILQRSIEYMEARVHADRATPPWSLAEAPLELVRRLREGVMAFRFIAESLEGIQRLNQDKDRADKYGIMAGLAASGQRDAGDILGLMARGLDGERAAEPPGAGR